MYFRRSLVSLFVRLWVEMPLHQHFSGKLWSASSWGCELKYYFSDVQRTYTCQPLREAVSWNRNNSVLRKQIRVSLFVRLWVEIYLQTNMSLNTLSASSWGCELKYSIPLFQKEKRKSASSWGCELKWELSHGSHYRSHVSLFVRLWVEMSNCISPGRCYHRQPLREAVSWNRTDLIASPIPLSQPLREAVSWNIRIMFERNWRWESASSWGCELKWY